MRIVLKDNDEVCHVWAHQNQETGHSGNVSFNGKRLYSYQACIGQLVTNARSERAVFLTARKWSVTTTAHQSSARSAVNHMRIFYVPDPGLCPELNRDLFELEISRKVDDIPKGHNRPARAKRLASAREAVESPNEFCRFFALPEFPAVDVGEDLESWCAAAKAREEERRVKALAKARRDEAKRVRERQSKLKAWLAGAPDVRRYELYGLPTHHLRVDPNETDMVETTLGAGGPLSHVLRFAPLILAKCTECRNSKTDWIPERHVSFGHYALDRIDEEGTVHVGCHRFAIQEITRFYALIANLVPVETTV